MSPDCIVLFHTLYSMECLVNNDVIFSFLINKNIIMSSFKSSRDIQKKEGGPDSCFG